MKWLNKYRKNLCRRFPEMIPVIERGLKQALEECRRQFSSYRWNCSPLNYKQVLNEGGILRKRSRETALVQALTAAGVMIEVAKTCVMKRTKYCGCGALNRRINNEISILHGCSDNINFGAYLATIFMDPKRANTHSKKVKRHNHIVGRRIVRQNTQQKCDCQSTLTGCHYKLCRRTVPKIETVGQEIWKLYQNPIRSFWNKTNNRLYKRVRLSRKIKTDGSKEIQDKLVFFKKSENFCEPNYSMGIVGTFGRACNHSSNGHDGCATMCCGRAYKTTVLVEDVKCNCRFVWGDVFDIKCEICQETRIVDKCG
ncbi:protein Wnt-2b-like [Dendronephthya gigantea]|nr:protein Wnt-2b-like [Dendronephthya gigantea]